MGIFSSHKRIFGRHVKAVMRDLDQAGLSSHDRAALKQALDGHMNERGYKQKGLTKEEAAEALRTLRENQRFNHLSDSDLQKAAEEFDVKL